MMDYDLDEALRRLANGPTHPRLADLEERVFARLGAKPAIAPAAQARIGAIAVAGALAIGMAGAGIPTATPSFAATVSPFGASMALAPSTLLLGSR